MVEDRALVRAKLIRWEDYMRAFRIPSWSEIPDIGLYMDQVLTILTQYLDYLPPELREEEFITASTIHNYVRRRIIPEPQGKKYYRKHLAYLIMLCTLKQSLSITTIRLLLPVDLTEDEMHAIYDSYADQHALSKGYFMDQVRRAASGIWETPETSQISTENVRELISQSAILAGFSKLLAEKLILLSDK